MEDVDSNSILFADRMITLPFSQIGEVHTTTPVSKDQVWSSVGKIFGQSVKIPVFPNPTAYIYWFIFIKWGIFYKFL
jgi:hypothetical protein